MEAQTENRRKTVVKKIRLYRHNIQCNTATVHELVKSYHNIYDSMLAISPSQKKTYTTIFVATHWPQRRCLSSLPSVLQFSAVWPIALENTNSLGISVHTKPMLRVPKYNICIYVLQGEREVQCWYTIYIYSDRLRETE